MIYIYIIYIYIYVNQYQRYVHRIHIAAGWNSWHACRKKIFKQSVPSTMKRIHNKPFKSFQMLDITQMGAGVISTTPRNKFEKKN